MCMALLALALLTGAASAAPARAAEIGAATRRQIGRAKIL